MNKFKLGDIIYQADGYEIESFRITAIATYGDSVQYLNEEDLLSCWEQHGCKTFDEVKQRLIKRYSKILEDVKKLEENK